MKKSILFLLAGMLLSSCGNIRNQSITYPISRKVDTVDVYFGTEVADPYRWLEDDRSEETKEWVNAQNKVTNTYLAGIPFRPALLNRLTDLANYEKISAPSKKFGKYYFFKNNGLQNQSVCYVQESLEAEPKVFLDPNQLSEDGTVALKDISFSNDGKHMAYTISRSGSDWIEIFVMDTETQRVLPDHIKWAKFSGATWYKDGFFYSAYDKPEAGIEFSSKNENHKVYYHKLGTPQSEDILFFENKDHPLRFYGVSVSDDEETLFMFESGVGRGNALYIKDMTNPTSQLELIADNYEYTYYPIDKVGDKIYLFTNYRAPNYRVMVANSKTPNLTNWKEVIPNQESVISSAQIIDNKLFITYNKDASSFPCIYTLKGELIQEVKLPSVGTASFMGNKDESDCFLTFTSYTIPTSIYKYNIEDNVYSLFNAPKVNFTPSDYESYQVFFESKDGTKVPMFITHKKGLIKNGTNPVYLYGYGGFNISINPSFASSRIPFLENGGVYVDVNLRGGGEYGEKWHTSGTQMQKQNVFDDFIAAAEFLIQENYTKPKNIAIAGGSNGGLLVGACMTQRPDLYGACIPRVGVMDMLRYHKFTIGWNWARDYGTSEDSKEMFEYLYKYSPLHALKPHTTYPPTLITTADHDDRVVPAHSFKFAARLQECNDGTHPALIRIDSKAGHGAGKPISKVLEEHADIYGFVMYNLGMNPKY